jgi:hypothetical protein
MKANRDSIDEFFLNQLREKTNVDIIRELNT